MSQSIGMLLVGHGTRDAEGIAEFLHTARQIATLLPEVAVEPGFLELAEPTIEVALTRLADRDPREIVVLPLLLFAAGHAKQDIPQEVAAAAKPFPWLVVRQAEPLGRHPQIVAASVERYRAALSTAGTVSDEPTFLIMVGRGSSDPEAIEDMRQFTQARHAATPTRQVVAAFMAMTRPTVAEALQMARESDCPCIVVQPHLLFHGQVLSDLRALVDEMREAEPNKTWLMTDHLGACQQVAAAAVDRFRQTLAQECG